MSYIDIMFIVFSIICLCICLFITCILMFTHKISKRDHDLNFALNSNLKIIKKHTMNRRYKKIFTIICNTILCCIISFIILINIKQGAFLESLIVNDKTIQYRINNAQINNALEENESITVKSISLNNLVTPFVTSSPKSDAVIHADLSNWSEEDRDILSNKYSGNNTMKLSVYNMIYAMGGGADDITAEIHLPFGERFDETWIINFVVMQDMVGNGSYANVTILSGDEELYPAFTIESDTTDKLEYEVNLSGIRDLVIRFECHAVDRGFCGGVIFTDKED